MYTMNYITTMKPYTYNVHPIIEAAQSHIHIKNDLTLPIFLCEINNCHMTYFIDANINYCLFISGNKFVIIMEY